MIDPLKAIDFLPRVIHSVAPTLTQDTANDWAAKLSPYMRSSGIVTPKRIAAFCGQIAVESGGFRTLQESLAYRAETLVKDWPHKFRSLAFASQFVGNQEGLASYLYANELGNGPPESRDGWIFRGRGLIQITGRCNYEEFAKSSKISLSDAVKFLETKDGAAASACWFWTKPGHPEPLNTLADAGNTLAITKAINGGTFGLSSRQELTGKAYAVFS